MKQLLKQIYNERRSNAFLWIELLLVFVVLWYIIDLVMSLCISIISQWALI